MNEVLTIPKNRTRAAEENFSWLRQKGMEYITALSGKLWTDHNLHDPGITILEVLCYALTEGGYKINFPIADLVSRLPGSVIKDFYTAREILTCNPTTITDFKKYIIDQEGIQNAWLYKLKYDSASTQPMIDQPAFYYRCDAVTKAYDLSMEPLAGYDSKYLNGLYNITLQLEEDEEFGDLNANVVEWLMPAGNPSTLLKVVFPIVSLQFPAWDHPLAFCTSYTTISNVTIAVSGTGGTRTIDLLEFEFDGDATKMIQFTNLNLVLTDISGSGTLPINSSIVAALSQMLVTSQSFPNLVFRRLQKIVQRIREVYCAVQEVRNLCEDYVRFSLVPQQEILLCADIELEPDADPEEILAQVYYRVDTFLSPPVRFYNLLELYEKGKTTEEIFDGPALEHGFILNDELSQSELRTEVHTSDLYNIIMSIPGVKTVSHLQLTNYLDGVAQTEGELWCLKLDAPYALNLSKKSYSKIHFYKSGLLFFADAAQVELLIKTLKAENSKPKLPGTQNDLPVPAGSYRNLSDYFSIQNDFPDVYKTGRNGIAPYDTQLRIAQTKQLKAFLLFFDQVLTNLFAQLDLAKDLLSLDQSISVAQTFAAVPVYDTVPTTTPNYFHVQNLFRSFTDTIPNADLDKESSYSTSWWEFAGDPYNDFLKQLQAAVETPDVYHKRMNRFLDHLIARFAENFGEYGDLTRKSTVFNAEEAGFVITSSGLPLQFGYQLFAGGVVKLEMAPIYPTEAACRDAIAIVVKYGVRHVNYQVDSTAPFHYRLLKNGTEIIGVNNTAFATKVLSESALFTVISQLKKFNDETIITDDKKRFLDDYVRLSSQRGKAFQYECCQMELNPGGWGGDNISGLQRRGARLLGIDDPNDRPLLRIGSAAQPLATGFNIHTAGALYRFEFLIDGVVQLDSTVPSFSSIEACREVIFRIIETGTTLSNYVIDDAATTVLNDADDFKFYLQEKDGTLLARHLASSPDRSTAEALIQHIIFTLKNIYYEEGFHLVEHILLRPLMDGPVTIVDIDEGYFPLCHLDEDCECPVEDHYSFRATIVFPYWPDRFRNMNFRAYAERVLRYEAPAHVLLKICWVNPADLFEFETLYSNWASLQCEDLPDRATLDVATADLIKKINNLENVYPEGVLHDCTQPSDDPAITLGQSALGVFDDEEDA